MYPPIHKFPEFSGSFERLDMLWEKYPQFHEPTTFTTLEQLLEDHESYQKDFAEELKEEYISGRYERYLIQLSWADLPYRYATRRLLEEASPFSENPYIKAFMDQFADLDTDRKACFLFPESFISQFFVVTEVCKNAEAFYPIRSIFPDEEKVHFLAVFDKQNMDDILLMYHLLYTNTSEDLYGGYSLYDYSLPRYQSLLEANGTVLRSPYLPDRIAKYQGNIPFYHNPSKTVYVRRNVRHLLECGYITSELAFFYDLRRTEIRTKLTADGIIRPKWKHELTLFRAVRKMHPDTLYQYRPEWLGRQSLDLYIPSLRTAIEYQGIQHYIPVEFFGGEEALNQRQELDRQKRELCEENGVRLIEWPYDMDPSDKNVEKALTSTI